MSREHSARRVAYPMDGATTAERQVQLNSTAPPEHVHHKRTHSHLPQGEPDPIRDYIGQTFVKGNRFQSFIALVILANAAVIGLETDISSQAWLWDILENSFLFIFTFELSLRLYYYGLEFFVKESERIPNWFDFLLVFLGLVDFTVTELVHGSLGGFSTVVRMCRLLRILRLFRLFKMFKQLYMLASGFVDSSVSVFWVSVLASLFLYVCSVFLARTLGHASDESTSLGDNSTDSGEESEIHIFYEENFGTVPRTMFTLFQLMADPGNLRQLKFIMFSDPCMLCFFITFIIFGSFAMLSILTGVISESMIQKGNDHKEEMRFAEERLKEKFIQELREYFQRSDTDGDGTMTREEFSQNLPNMVQMFQDHDFSYSAEDLIMVFDLVDFDSGGTIELDEFLQGMTSFTGNVNDMPLQLLRLQSNCYLNFEKLKKKCDTRLDGLTNKFMTVEDRMKRMDDQLTNLIAAARQ